MVQTDRLIGLRAVREQPHRPMNIVPQCLFLVLGLPLSLLATDSLTVYG